MENLQEHCDIKVVDESPKRFFLNSATSLAVYLVFFLLTLLVAKTKFGLYTQYQRESRMSFFGKVM